VNAITKFGPKVTQSDRDAYERDGAIVLRNVLDPIWVERMRTAIADISDNHSGLALWMSRVHPEFAAFAAQSGLAEVAADVMGVDAITFLYDQMFVKQPKSDNPTPLHQDLPYWPVAGNEIVSVWVPFDHVTRDNSVVQYVKGSHRWGRMFEPVSFVKGVDRAANVVGSAGYEEINDPQALIDANEVAWWELGPGDVLIHHPLTLHFATPNLTSNEGRRAIALRYLGPDVRFHDRPGNFMRRDNAPSFWPAPLVEGAAMGGPDYPLVWTRQTSDKRPGR